MALTQREISARHYQRRRDGGLCPKCGKKLDRKGYYCSECLIAYREYVRANRAFYRSMGICPECGKEKLFGDEKYCLLCRAKREARRKPLTEEQKKKRADLFKKQQKELREQRKLQGICTRCGKRKVAVGKKKCKICLSKDAEAHRKRYYDKPNIKEYRKENGLCYFCGETAEEHKNVCAKCSERCSRDRQKAKSDNKHWRSENKLILKN